MLTDFEPMLVRFGSVTSSSSVMVNVTIVDDDLLEETEFFNIQLSNPSLGSVSTDILGGNTPFATVCIIDNDSKRMILRIYIESKFL